MSASAARLSVAIRALEGRWAVAVIALALAILAALTWTLNLKQPIGGPDDAFITYRYARNLANGEGFVFNPGDTPVQGTSTPLYTLVLAAGSKLGADIPTLSVVIGGIAMAVSVALLYLLGRELKHAHAGIACALSLAASPFPAEWYAGMETSLYVAVILGTFLALVKMQYGFGVFLAALAVLIRLDGIALWTVTLGFCLWQRKSPWKAAILGSALIAAWFGFAYVQFGSVLPASASAKLAHEAGISGVFLPLAHHFFFLAAPLTSLHIILLLVGLLCVFIALPMVYKICRQSEDLALLGVWLLGYMAGFTLAGLPDFIWYYAPAAAVASLLLWSCLERFVGAHIKKQAMQVTLALAIFAAILVITLPRSAWTRETTWQGYTDAGQWLRDNAPAGSTVAAYEVGIIGFVSDLEIIDILGLTEPAALDYLKEGDYAWVIRERNPSYVFLHQPEDWVVTDAIYDSDFRQRYRFVQQFKSTRKTDYLLYERVSP